MGFQSTNNQKKSFLITCGIFGLLLLTLFFLRFNDSITTMMELEGGGGGGDVAVNFGDSDFGMGSNFQSKEPAFTPSKATAPVKSSNDEIVVSDNDDAVAAVNNVKKNDKPEKKPDPKPVEQPVRRPDKSTSNALSDLLNGNNTGGDGNDNRAGNKGQASGNVNDRGYDGSGGTGGGKGGGNGTGEGVGSGSGYGSGTGGGRGSGSGNWNLNGRKLNASSKFVQDCNESGTVVVEVKVDRNGKVQSTKYTKGTTNTSPCLLEPAYQTARSYKWNADPTAPEIQTGTITINFKLGE